MWDSPEEHPAEGKAWVEDVEEPGRIAVVMETSTLEHDPVGLIGRGLYIGVRASARS